MILKHRFTKYIPAVLTVFLLLTLVFSFIYTGRTQSSQSQNALYPSVNFQGQYKVGDGGWQTFVEGEHIPANKGDVTLKGCFNLVAPDTGDFLGKAQAGTVIAFYLNHISAEIYEDGNKSILDTELYIAGEDLCGTMCIGYECVGSEDITIIFKNPHSFGNARAVDEFFSNLSVYGGTDYEKDMLNRGNPQRTLGIVFVMVAFMIMGTALFSMLIHVKGNVNILLIGFAVFFAGIYFVFSAHGIMYWSSIIKFNTRVLGAAGILYMLSLTSIVVSLLKGKPRKWAKALLVLLAATDTLVFIIPMVTHVKFYDILFAWAIFQSVVCIAATVFLIHGFVSCEKNEELFYAFSMPPVISFVLDVIGEYMGWWENGFVSKIVFIIIFIISFVLLMNIVTKEINATTKARELEIETKSLQAELAESRIAIMISQIQPHFIYNTLGTIEQLCLSEPEAASKLVRNFSLYLRGNFSELDKIKPIRFSQEINHVKHYTDIEQVRFPDMTINYDLGSVDFSLPALSVQPLVENAIKHGLMGLEEGGNVTISSFETPNHYVVVVKDDGVGFDTEAGYDETKHIGIVNIRGRIEAMCDGTVTIESTVGKGTTATIKIPKEISLDDCNRS